MLLSWREQATRELYYLVVLSILLSGGHRWAVEAIWEIKPGTSPLVFKYHPGFVGLEISMKGNEEEEEEQVEEEMQGLALRNSPEYPQCLRRTNSPIIIHSAPDTSAEMGRWRGVGVEVLGLAPPLTTLQHHLLEEVQRQWGVDQASDSSLYHNALIVPFVFLPFVYFDFVLSACLCGQALFTVDEEEQYSLASTNPALSSSIPCDPIPSSFSSTLPSLRLI
ncbi:unnamed protein product [Arctogadus glacialis]